MQECIHDLFASMLRFWYKACKFYRRRKLWNFTRAAWNNYDIEFAGLEVSMTKALNRVEKGALAEHIGVSNAFMAEQRLITKRNCRTPPLEAEEAFPFLDLYGVTSIVTSMTMSVSDSYVIRILANGSFGTQNLSSGPKTLRKKVPIFGSEQVLGPERPCLLHR